MLGSVGVKGISVQLLLDYKYITEGSWNPQRKWNLHSKAITNFVCTWSHAFLGQLFSGSESGFTLRILVLNAVCVVKGVLRIKKGEKRKKIERKKPFTHPNTVGNARAQFPIPLARVKNFPSDFGYPLHDWQYCCCPSIAILRLRLASGRAKRFKKKERGNGGDLWLPVSMQRTLFLVVWLEIECCFFWGFHCSCLLHSSRTSAHFWVKTWR